MITWTSLQIGLPFFAFAIEPDGGFLIGGRVWPNRPCSSAIFRHNPDGSLDQTFRTTIGPTNVDSSLGLIFPEPNGQIIIGGSFNLVNGVRRVNLARLNPDGSLDPNFAADFDSAPGYAYNGALQSDGKVLMSFYNSEFGPQRLLRFNSDGSVDPTFLAPGFRILAMQPDGNIIVAGRYGYGQPLRLFGKTDNLTGFTFSPDGDFTAPADAIGWYQFPVPVSASGETLKANVYRLGATTNTASVDF